MAVLLLAQTGTDKRDDSDEQQDGNTGAGSFSNDELPCDRTLKSVTQRFDPVHGTRPDSVAAFDRTLGLVA
jgi:hypothetical protein